MSDTNEEGNDLFGELIEKKLDKPYSMYENSSGRVLHVYINEEIKEPKLYTDLVHTIKGLSSNDMLYMYLNSPGGDVITGIQIINAMRSTQGRIVTVLESEACSMASLIFLCGHDYIVNPNTMLMFHNYSGGVIGKGNEMISRINKTAEWFGNLNKEICYPFLSHEEIDRLLEGTDFWIFGSDIEERLTRMADLKIELNKQDRVLQLKESILVMTAEVDQLENELKKSNEAESKIDIDVAETVPGQIVTTPLRIRKSKKIEDD